MTPSRPSSGRLLSVWCCVLLGLGCWLPGGAGVAGRTTQGPGPLVEARDLLEAGRYREAEDRAREYVARLDGLGDADPLEVSRGLDLLAEAFWRGGRARSPEALDVVRRALALKEEAPTPDPVGIGLTLRHLGRILIFRGEYDEAHQALERALDLEEAALGPRSGEVSRTLRALGIALRAQGRYEESLSHYQRSLAILEEAEPENELGRAEVMNNLANVLSNLGRLEEAHELLFEVAAVMERRLGPDHPRLATILNNLALVLTEMGRYAGARPLYERSLSIRTRALGPEHIDVAQSLGNLGMLLWGMGDHAAASEMFERALKTLVHVLGPDHPGVALMQHNLGYTLTRQGRYEEARVQFERALETRRKVFGPSHLFVADTLISLSDLERSTGNLETARDLSRQALEIQENSLGPTHPRLALTWWNLGTLWEQSGDLEAAIERYRRALSLREAALGAQHPKVTRVRADLSRALWKAGRSEEALTLALEAEEGARRHVLQAARALSEREALGLESTRTSGRDVALSILASGSSTASDRRRVWDQLVRSRALVLDEMAGRHRVSRSRQEPEVRELVESLDRARDQLSTLLVRGAGRTSPEEHRDRLAAARRKVEEAERALSLRSRTFREELSRRRVGGGEVSASLPARSALVSFHLYQRIDPGAQAVPGALTTLREGVLSYVALVLRSGAEAPQVVPLGTAEAIDARVAAWTDAASAAPSILPALARRAEAEVRAAGESLRGAIWAPLSDRLGDAELVFIVPDGALHFVNLAALPDGEARYLVETGPSFHYLSAERDLAGGAAAVRGHGALVLGGPDFDAPSPEAGATGRGTGHPDGSPPLGGEEGGGDCRDLASITFAALPAARREAEEVAALFRARTPEAVPVDLLLGDEAREGRFRDLVPGHRFLHLATHAFVLGEGCDGAAVESGWEPLLRSGFGLAGANRRAHPEADEASGDGMLTALEVSSLDLRGVQWAVLSACASGTGRVQQGEGLLGLRRAFEVAGVETLILSLWAVQDEAAREWMVQLYRGQGEGLSTVDAVRSASRAVLDTRREAGLSTHPFYWGAFVAAGDWR